MHVDKRTGRPKKGGKSEVLIKFSEFITRKFLHKEVKQILLEPYMKLARSKGRRSELAPLVYSRLDYELSTNQAGVPLQAGITVQRAWVYGLPLQERPKKEGSPSNPSAQRTTDTRRALLALCLSSDIRRRKGLCPCRQASGPPTRATLRRIISGRLAGLLAQQGASLEFPNYKTANKLRELLETKAAG